MANNDSEDLQAKITAAYRRSLLYEFEYVPCLHVPETPYRYPEAVPDLFLPHYEPICTATPFAQERGCYYDGMTTQPEVFFIRGVPYLVHVPHCRQDTFNWGRIAIVASNLQEHFGKKLVRFYGMQDEGRYDLRELHERYYPNMDWFDFVTHVENHVQYAYSSSRTAYVWWRDLLRALPKRSKRQRRLAKTAARSAKLTFRPIT